MKHYAAAFALGRLGRAGEAAAEAEAGERLPTDFCFPNRPEERAALEYAVGLLPAAPRARYYLGELLYDRRQYAAAAAQWEAAVREEPGLAPAWRCLSIARWNHGDRALAEEAIAEACRLEPDNSRFLLEQDQLLRRLERPAEQRLAILEAHGDLLGDRCALTLAWAELLNADGQHEKALGVLLGHTFHVWEGGEGKVADAYRTALFALAERALEENRPADALELARRTLAYPPNLGEGKLDNVPDNRAWYLMGLAQRALGCPEEAGACFRRAAEGPQEPQPVRYYNDQPSDYIYWQGLAFRELGETEAARRSFHRLLTFGERHRFDRVGYDFFAVSLPELEVYQDDIQKRSDAYCARLAELGRKGLAALSAPAL